MGVLGRAQEHNGGVHGGDHSVGFEWQVLSDVRTPRTHLCSGARYLYRPWANKSQLTSEVFSH